MKKIITLILCFFLSLSSGLIKQVEAEENVVYLDPAMSSSHSENVYTTLMNAANALPSNGGTIVVCSDFSITGSAITLPAKPIRITGETSSVKITQTKALKAGGNLVIDNITWVAGASGAGVYIYAQGHDLTIGENVTSLPYNNTGYCLLFGGSPNANVANANNTITVRSGIFNALYAGSHTGSFTGTLNINLDGGEIKNNIYLAGFGAKGTFNGTVNLNVNGAKVGNISKNSASGVFTGTANVTLKAGRVSTFSSIVPDINLSLGGELTIPQSLTVNNLTGGGTINLIEGAVLTAADYSGTTNLNITNPITNTTYLIINNPNAAGNINYLQATNEILEKEVNSSITYTIKEASAPVALTTVYVDPAGTSAHTENVYSSFEAAANALADEGGTIIICSDTQIATSTAHYYMPAKPIRITGETSNVRLIQNRSFFIQEECEIDNITWVNNSNASYAFLYCQGHDFTVGENVTCIANGSTYLCILAGSASINNNPNVVGNITNGNTTITVNSGTFRRIFCGGLGRSYQGIVNVNINDGTIYNNLYLTGSNSGGNVSGTVNVTLDGGSIADLTQNTAAATFSGTANIVLKSGSLNTTNLVPAIDLRDGGTLNLTSSLAADSIIGGGQLVLGGSVSVSADSLSGNVDLSINGPVDEFVYLTINDKNSTGVINYIPKNSDALNKIVNDNNIQYVMANELKTHVRVVYYNPDGAEATQPNIVLYKGHVNDEDKVLIDDYDSGIIDEYKHYIEKDLDPGLYYFRVYFKLSSDYVTKYIYITGEESEELVYDFPFIPYTANNYEEATISFTTDQVIENFWNFSKLNVEDFELVTPTFTLEKYTRNIRAFMNNEDMCAFIDNLSSPYLHVYYPFDLSPMGNKSPILVFTKDDVDANISLVDLAAEVNSYGPREIFMINGGQHGNEPSGMEGSLQLAYELCGEYGEEVLDHFGAIIIFPCVSVDNTQRFKREYADGCNSNRDMLYLHHEGSQNFAYIYQLFMPTTFINAHEDNEYNTIDTSDYSIDNIRNMSLSLFSCTPNIPLIDVDGMIDGTYDLNTDEDEAMMQRIIDKACAQGFRAAHYPNIRPGVNAEKSYALVRGSYSFTLEVQRIWSGKLNYDFSIKSTVVAMKDIIEEIIDVNTNNEKTLAQKVYNARQASKVTEYSENRRFATKLTATVGGTDAYPQIYIDGTYKDANATKTWKHYSAVETYRTMPLSYVIPADLEHIDEILHLLDMHGIAYTSIPSGTTRVLKEYSITDTNGDRKMVSVSIGENAEVTFENGAYEISLNTTDAYLIAFLFEPDTDNNSSELYFSNLYKMSYMETTDHLYRYETDDIAIGEPANVTFMANNEIYETYEDVPYNSLINKPSTDPVKEGSIFVGWYKDAGFNNEWNFAIDRLTEDSILYAKFVQGHRVTVIDAGYNTSHKTVESSSWATSTGGEVVGDEAYVTVVGDYSNTTGAALSIYTDLSDVTALKIKVGDNPEQTIPYSGTKITKYYKGNHTIGDSVTAASDIVKVVINASTSTLISTRFYNISEDITFTFVHNTRNINYVDEEDVTVDLSYNSLIEGYLPNGNSYDVPVTSLANDSDNKYVNLCLSLDNDKVDGIIIKTTNDEYVINKTNEEIINNEQLGKVTATPTINGNSLIFNIRFDKLNEDVTVSPKLASEKTQTAQGVLEENGTIDFVITSPIDSSVDLETAYVLVDGEKTYLNEITDNGVATFKTPAKAPRQLNDVISIRYYDGENNPISEESQISVTSYINYLINDSNTSQKDKAFYKSLLNYGAYAQQYFEYNKENLANEDLQEEDKNVSSVTYEDVADKAAQIEGNTEGISAYGQSLILKNEVRLKVYFKLTGSHSIDEYNFTDGSTILTPHHYVDEYYYVTINRNAAPDLGNNHTITVKLETEGDLNVTCSVLTYAEIVLRDEPLNEKEVDLANLTRAMYLYNQNAKNLLGE